MRQVWTYSARDHSGRQIKGEIEGESKPQILRSISEQGLIPTQVEKRREKISLSSVLGNFGSANRERLIIFTKKLKTLHRAGIPILRALSIMERGAEDAAFREEIKEMREDMQSGIPLSKALGRYPHRFPPMYIASVAAGEASGSLDEVLEQLSNLIEKEMVLARQLKSAVRYPLMVIIAVSAAIFVIMSFVVPRFVGLYSRFGADLPLPTKIIIAVSHFFAGYWYVMLAVVILTLLALKRFVSTERGRLKWDEFVLRIPIFGDLIVKANIARFAAMLKILFHSGVPIITCMNILKETATNKRIAEEIAVMTESFERGREIGVDPERYRYIPNMALEMLQVGLESGSVESIMGELSTHYEMELEYKSRQMTALLEPILTVVIGGVVLVLALSIFLPMWNLIKVFR